MTCTQTVKPRSTYFQKERIFILCFPFKRMDRNRFAEWIAAAETAPDGLLLSYQIVILCTNFIDSVQYSRAHGVHVFKVKAL